MKKNNQKISVIIPTRYDDIELARVALDSVRWADEILLVDSSRTAGGQAEMKILAEKTGSRYLFRPYDYSARQKNWAIPQAKYDWILLLDSDEVVTKKLKKTIQEIVKSEKMEKFDGFAIARKHFFFGKFLRWGGRYPLYNVRFFRKTCRYEDRDVHAHIILDKKRLGFIKPKDGDILHFSDRDFTQFFERFDRYSTYQANYMKKVADRKMDVKWKSFFVNFLYFKAVVKDVWFFIPGTAFLRFVYMYVVRLGFLDGRHGLSIALFYAMQDYVTKTKFYALQERKTADRRQWEKRIIERITRIVDDSQESVTAIKVGY